MAAVDEGTATQPTTEMESVESLTGRPVIESTLGTVWTHKQAIADKRAPLRIYLGAAPGVGKTYAMLDEGQRRLERGSQVVIGVVETYDRPKTKALVDRAGGRAAEDAGLSRGRPRWRWTRRP